MKATRPPIGALVGVLALIVGCAGGLTLPAGRAPLPEDPAAAPAEGVLELQVHDLVNDRRNSRGLRPLQWDVRIADAAREHSRAMAARRRDFGHEDFDSRATAIQRLMTVRSIAENVAYDSRTGDQLASHVVAGWMASSGHRQNIEGGFTRTGIGVARGTDGVRYFTQIFVDGD